MSDVASAETYVDGQTVNAARLNNMINAALAQPGIIGDRPSATPTGADQLLLLQSGALKRATVSAVGTSGGIGLTSVGLSMPSDFAVANSPLVANGSLNVTRVAQTGNKVMASDPSGNSSIPTMRARDVRDSRYPTVVIAAATIDWNLATHFFQNLTGNHTYTFINAGDGQRILVALTNNGWTVAWPANVRWQGGVVPTPSATATSIFEFANINGFYFGWMLSTNAF